MFTEKCAVIYTLSRCSTPVICFLPWNTNESSHSTFPYNEAEWGQEAVIHIHCIQKNGVTIFLTNFLTKWHFHFWVIYSFNGQNRCLTDEVAVSQLHIFPLQFKSHSVIELHCFSVCFPWSFYLGRIHSCYKQIVENSPFMIHLYNTVTILWKVCASLFRNYILIPQ